MKNIESKQVSALMNPTGFKCRGLQYERVKRMVSYLLGTPALIFLLSCTKPYIEPANTISYNIGADHYEYTSSYTNIEYCGQRLITITGKNQDKMFLISIVTDSLRSGTYTAGSNIFAGEFRTWSEDMKVEVAVGSGLSGTFAGTVHFGERVYQLSNGKFKINKQ